MPTGSRIAGIATVLAVVLGGMACRGGTDSRLLDEAEALYLEGRFEEAVPVLKRFLLQQPFDPGGHLYLGMCYALSDQWLFPAEGEILTALTFFERNGGRSTIARFPDEYFAARCYLELLKISHVQVQILLEEGFASDETFRTYVDKFKHYLAKAKELAGDEPYVQECEKLAQAIDDGTVRMQRRRRPYMPPNMMPIPGVPPGIGPMLPPGAMPPGGMPPYLPPPSPMPQA